MLKLAKVAIAAFAILVTGIVQAQEVPGFRPGREIEQLRQPLHPQAGHPLFIPENPNTEVPPEAESVRFTLLHLNVESITAYPAAEIQAMYADLIGTEVSLADVYHLAEKITLKYRDDGYVLSRAVVPAQTIDDGTLRIVVVEGFIDSIRFEGSEWMRWRLDAIASKITGKKPVNVSDIERGLLLLNDLPGVKAKAIIRPSEKRHGASELVITTEYQPVNASVSLDNYGTKYTGERNTTEEIYLNSLSTLGERISYKEVQGNPMNAQRVRSLAFSLPFNNDGLVAYLDVGNSRVHPLSTLKYLGVFSETQFHSGHLSYPFIRSRSLSLTGESGYRYKAVNVYTAGNTLFSRDHISTLYGRSVLDFVDSFSGSNVVSIDYTHAMNMMGLATSERSDTIPRSRTNARDNFYKWNAEAIRQQDLPWSMGLILGAMAQATSTAQFSSEEFAVGGRSYGRGYAPGEISGDKGFAVKAELNYRFDSGWKWWRMTVPYAFYDFGNVWNVDADAKNTNTAHQTLASTGIGIRNSLVEDYLMWNIEVAKPLTRVPDTVKNKDSSEQKLPRFFVGITLKY